MRFIDREKEIEYLKESAELSKTKLFTVSLSGLRRIGKTRLLFELLKEKDIYFFVNKDKTSKSLLEEYEETLKDRKILTKLESLKNWEQFFEVLFGRFQGIIVFDEFQNFVNVDKPIFGILQKYIDMNEKKKDLLLIFSGSIIGMMKKLFSKKEPLYGRLKRKLDIKQLDFSDVVKMCHELKIRDTKEIVMLYAIFGGFPKYYVSIEDENLKGGNFEKIMERLFLMQDAVLEDEVSQILSLEFGKRSGVYYDILAAIANGSTRISEIASFLRKKETALTRQINELINYFELVGVEKPVVNGKSLLFIRHPLIKFWFRFFYRNISSYKRREKWLIERIKGEINSYVGREFENVCREALIKANFFEFTKIGRWWGYKREEGERKSIEIDIVALNDNTKEILFGECKWQNKVDASKVLWELREKAKYVKWYNEERKEHYAIFAKSFKEKAKQEGLLLFDLKDIEKALKSV